MLARASTNLIHTQTHTHTHTKRPHTTHTLAHTYTHTTHTRTRTGAALTKVSSKKASKDEEVNTARVYIA